MANKHVITKGPLFDGRADKAVRDFIVEFAENYADTVNDELRGRFALQFQNPTGRYARSVRARKVGRGVSEVNGTALPYAGWLEGTSRRNRKSSFKGYHLFRRVTWKEKRRVKAVANAEFKRRYLRRLNGWL